MTVDGRDLCVKLARVSYVENMEFNLFSLHQAEDLQRIALDELGTHLLDGQLTFPRRSRGSSPWATRLPPDYEAPTAVPVLPFSPTPPPRASGVEGFPPQHAEKRHSAAFKGRAGLGLCL